jgi:hypothetical protein
MARIVVQYPLQDLGMHQRAIEERRGHSDYDRGSEQIGKPSTGELFPWYRIWAIYANCDQCDWPHTNAKVDTLITKHRDVYR